MFYSLTTSNRLICLTKLERRISSNQSRQSRQIEIVKSFLLALTKLHSTKTIIVTTRYRNKQFFLFLKILRSNFIEENTSTCGIFMKIYIITRNSKKCSHGIDILEHIIKIPWELVILKFLSICLRFSIRLYVHIALININFVCILIFGLT